MFCINCGKQIPDDAVFCTGCGARVEVAETPSAATPASAQLASTTPASASAVRQSGTPAPTAPPVGQQPAVVYAVQAPAPKKRGTRAVIITLVCVIVVAGLIGGLLYKRSVDARPVDNTAWASYTQAHSMHAVVFTVSAPGYDDATCSKIPLHVAGTDANNKDIDIDAYIGSDGRGLSLAEGSYTVTVEASPLLAGGTIYDTPMASWNVTIGNDIDKDAEVAISADQPVAFTVTDPLAITDEQLQAAYDAAIASGMETATADNLKAAVQQAQQAAVDKKAADDAAAAAELAAARHYSDSYIEFDMPESWVGRMHGTCMGHTSGVWHTDFYYPNGKYSFMVIRFGGNFPDHSCEWSYTNSAKELWDATHGSASSDMTVDELKDALNLQTGGSLSYDDVVAMSSEDEAEAAGKKAIDAYYNETISPTVKAK